MKLSTGRNNRKSKGGHTRVSTRIMNWLGAMKLSKLKLKKPKIGSLSLNNFKIQNKLILMVLITVLVPLLVLSVIFMNNASDKIKAQVLNSNLLYTTLTKERIDGYFFNREVDGRILANSKAIKDGLEKLNSFNYSDLEEEEIMVSFNAFLHEALESHDYTDIVITNKYGEIVFSSNYKKNDIAPLIFSGDFNERAKQGEQNWSTVFRNTFIDDNLIVLATPVYVDSANPPIGVLNIILNQDKINGIVQNGIDKLGISGDSYLINAEGLLLTNTVKAPEQEFIPLKDTIISEAVHTLATPIENAELDFNNTMVYKDYLGKSVIGTLSVAKIGDNLAGLVIEVEESEAYGSILELRTSIMGIVSIILCIAVVLAMILARSITGPIIEVIGITNEIANFNLKKRKTNLFRSRKTDIKGRNADPLQIHSEKREENINEDIIVRKDEIGDLERAIIKIRDNLKNIIQEVEKSAREVATSSQQLMVNAQQSSASVEQVVSTMNELNIRSIEQAQSVKESFEKSTELSYIIVADKGNLEEMTVAMDNVNQLVASGLEVIDVLSNITKESSGANKEVYSSILKSQESSKKIESASKLITAIADQTNLLALNAAIEAARAGEYGRGFAVVAEEVRKLADQSKETTRIIDQIVQNLNIDHIEAVQTMENLVGINKEQVESVVQTKDKYLEIAKAMNVTEHKVKRSNESSLKMDEMRLEVEERLQRVVNMTEENSHSISEVSMSMEEQAASVQEITKACEMLDELARDLQVLVGRFQIV